MLTIIRAAKDGHLLGWIDCDKPETQGNSRVNAFLKHIKATAGLRPGHAQTGGKRQSISSHSIRRAAVSMDAVARGWGRRQPLIHLAEKNGRLDSSP